MDFKNRFTGIRVVEDNSGGIVKLKLVQTINQDRASKLQNNFLGKLTKANPATLTEVIQQLNSKLPARVDGEVIIGPATSGIILAAFLAEARNSSYNYSIPDKFAGFDEVVSFSEDHRDDKQHYFYGLHPGDKVIIIEDEIWSGRGVIAMIESLMRHDIKIIAVASIIESTNFGARENIAQITSSPFISLVKIELE